jgi:hypothetical protein
MASAQVNVQNSHFPRQFQSNIRFKHQFRYISTAAMTADTMTRQDLVGMMVVNLTGTTANACIFAGVKVNRIEMYAVGGNTSALPFSPATVACEWLSSVGPSSEVSDTGNAMQPAKIVSSPPPKSLCGFWSLTGQSPNEQLFALTGPVGTIVNVFCELVLRDDEATNTVTTINNGLAGQLYELYLDLHLGAAASLQPVSYFANF